MLKLRSRETYYELHPSEKPPDEAKTGTEPAETDPKQPEENEEEEDWNWLTKHQFQLQF